MYLHFVQTLEYLIELILCCYITVIVVSFLIQDLGCGAFLTAESGSGIRCFFDRWIRNRDEFKRVLDLGSRIQPV
jgi:hypothetical protein